MSQTPTPLTHEELFAHHDTGGSGLGAFTATLPEPTHDAEADLPDTVASDTRLSTATDGIRVGSVITINTVIQGTVTDHIGRPEDEHAPADTDTDAYEAYAVDPVGDSIAGQLTIYRASPYDFSDDWKYYTAAGDSADIAHVAVDNEITPAADTDAERYERLKATTGPVIHCDPSSPSSVTVGTIDGWNDGTVTIAHADGTLSEDVAITCDGDREPHSWYSPEQGADGFMIGGQNPVIRDTVAYETDSDPAADESEETAEGDTAASSGTGSEAADQPDTHHIPDPLGVTSQPLPEPQRDALDAIAALPAGKYLLGPAQDTGDAEMGLYTVASTGRTARTAPQVPIQVLPTGVCHTAFHTDVEFSDAWDNLVTPDLSHPTPTESTVTADASLTDMTGIGPETARRIRGESATRSSHQTSKSPTDIAYVLDDDETFESVDATMTVEKVAPDEQSEAFRQAQANYTPPEDKPTDTAETADEAASKTLADFLPTHPNLTDVASRFVSRTVADLRSAMSETALPTGEAIQRAFTYTTAARLVDQDGAAISNHPQLAIADDDWPSPPPAVAMTWGASTASPLPREESRTALVSATPSITPPVDSTDDTRLAESDGQSVDTLSAEHSASTARSTETETAILVATPESYCPAGTHLDEKTVSRHEETLPDGEFMATTQVEPGLLRYVGALFDVSLTTEYLCQHARITTDGTLLISHESPHVDCWFALTASGR